MSAAISEASAPGPGPSTLAHPHVAPRPYSSEYHKPLRSLSFTTKRLSRDQLQPLQQQRPISILCKPSLPALLPSSATVESSSSSLLATPDGGLQPPISTPVMPPTPGSATFAFPPLPPLPPYSTGGNMNRRSAPPTITPVVHASQSVRMRGRHSRVSFREDVDIAAEYRARSTSRPRSGPPAGAMTACPSVSIADPIPSTMRRSSADGFQMFHKPQLAPRPALKRASSQQPLALIKTGRDSCDDFFDAFRPQALRYPKVSPALARLSDGSIPSPSLWNQQPNRKSVALTASPTSFVPALSSSSSASSPCSSSASPSIGGMPGRKTRTPRSPIPSWSSVATSCPSLVSSSHRASMASTLTAPSMTSLLLSPPSPTDHLAMMPSPGFMDDIPLHYSPRRLTMRDAGDDIPHLDPLAAGAKGRGTVHMHTHGMARAESPDSDSDVTLAGYGAENAKRNQPRRSEPVSLYSTSDSSPSSLSLLPPQPPRAKERLLRLQLSLADLRMQRRAEEEKQAAAAEALQAQRRASTSNALPSPRPRAPSPTLGDLVRKLPRDQMLPTDLDLESDDESDLDLSLPPLNAALRSHVIPSSSRLLTKNGRAADGSANDDGWSGSESEEEEFSRTVARIAQRKSSIGAPTPRRLLKRPSLPASRVSRYSDFGVSADRPSSPSAASEQYAASFDSLSIASRRSTANSISSARPSGTAALINALVEQKYASSEKLPRPKRFVEGWGAPEVLEDDEWPPDNHGQLETLSEVW